ncbi:MAG: histidinol-phosphatase [Pseudomonadota bacterium]|nr:histidinol-phosphatase [Pseudomonadota bacterium]
MAKNWAAEFLDFAISLADTSGPIIRRHFRTPMKIDTKPDNSPVTIADQEVEQTMRALIAEHYPEHGVFGEEFGQHQKDSEFQWCLDPIDGTKAFTSGKPIFGTLISLLHLGQPIIGIIDQPILHERWIGSRGEPTVLNGSQIHTRFCSTLENAVLNTTSPDMFIGGDWGHFRRLSDKTKDTVYGGDCYGYAMLACGHIDLVVEADLKPYDYLALMPVLQGAGALISDWQGNSLDLNSDGHVIAAGDSELLPKVVEVLNSE